MPKLSVIVPVYNEARTIKQILEKINSVPIDKEIIVVNDGSSDGTEKILKDIKYGNLKVVHHSGNRGKGAAFLTGLSCAQGEFVIIQDADLEYEPGDYLKLMR
ncbi:MAG: glycosyltransferase family 2 protein, partial [Candidatus Omnitrophica bacterium]|nr:glycosyltransferase family 2 protein [Candidatus Omnitrophota bacterium]